jgi:hypothetical protein
MQRLQETSSNSVKKEVDDGGVDKAATTATTTAVAWRDDLIRNMINVCAISLHSVIAGTSLGYSNETGGLDSIFIAIISHKLFASLAVGSRIISTSASPCSIYSPLIVFCLMTPLGALIGHNGRSAGNEWLDMTLDAISCGSFLYMGVVGMVEEHDMAHRESHEDCPVTATAADEEAAAAAAAPIDVVVNGGCDTTAKSKLAPLTSTVAKGTGDAHHAENGISIYGQYASLVMGVAVIAIATHAIDASMLSHKDDKNELSPKEHFRS